MMDFLLLRFFERITVVLISGMAIYPGFRLFLAVPELRESDGQVTLPWNISIVMTRVGPEVFFALFGIAEVSLALYRPLEMTVTGAGRAGGEEGQRFSYAAGPALGDRTARADARALLRIVLPVFSLKFLDDVCTAYAWLQVKGYSREAVSEYTAILQYGSMLGHLPPALNRTIRHWYTRIPEALVWPMFRRTSLYQSHGD
jgi:hypothetical protein